MMALKYQIHISMSLNIHFYNSISLRRDLTIREHAGMAKVVIYASTTPLRVFLFIYHGVGQSSPDICPEKEEAGR